jgi:hypothetical protein
MARAIVSPIEIDEAGKEVCGGSPAKACAEYITQNDASEYFSLSGRLRLVSDMCEVFIGMQFVNIAS